MPSKVVDARKTGAAVALSGRLDDDGAALGSDLGGGVRRIIVGYDDAPHRSASQRLEDERQRAFFVERRDDDIDRRGAG